MRVTITCPCSADADHYYDLLTNPNLGTGVLSGEKICLDDHNMVPDIMEFDLSKEEIDELKKIDNNLNINIELSTKIELHYTKLRQNNIPRLATFTTNFSNNQSITLSVPNALYYCQNYDLSYTQSAATSNSVQQLDGVDCSNVDIIIMDTGIDPSHPDFKDDNGVSRVVEFDWGLLKDDSGNKILNVEGVTSDLPLPYYIDVEGHGTTCAGLAAGRTCGFAKNAKLYSMKAIASTLYNSQGDSYVDGIYDVTTALKLVLAFQKAKKQNLYGLSSSRPTIFSNSWGSVGLTLFEYLAVKNIIAGNASGWDTLKLSGSIGNSTDLQYYGDYNKICGRNDIYDGYIRQIITEGVHTLVSAGNDNIYCDQQNPDFVDFHLFLDTGTNQRKLLTRSLANNSLYVINNIYEYTGANNASLSARYLGAVSTPYNYQSPDIGIGYSKTTFPIIKVGCITPIGTNDANDVDANLYDSSSYSKSIYNVIISNYTLNRTDIGIVLDNTVRYNSIKGPFYVKSPYSNFGPAVDIYCFGSAAWAAHSNQILTLSPNFKKTALSNNDRYKFANGTSASTPITAGILATYLASNPTATPLQAKNWLINNGIKGQVMKTTQFTDIIQLYNGTNSYNVTLQLGSILNIYGDAEKMQTLNSYRLRRVTGGESFYNTANIYDVLFGCRFFGSNNVIPQAFPLRKAVIKSYSNTSTANIGGTTLNRSSQTTDPITHTQESYTLS